ncbi:BrnT family toxin [Sphingomonas morindae]|uniref:BrnT family toxin n=1 Tax=Sphingomonas morindae TaxID=1541170 RepID=A0ABY4X6Z5_9SPHN|nr:BrnT family toxin [Sphingomonas morindae]USI72704.1 BrnT family toxin [Sphingomonas morindae]
MDIVFDPAKDAINQAKHGLSLAEAEELDLRGAALLVDDRADYGEVRFRAFGRIDGEGRCLVFTLRAGVIRAISFRRAHEKELRRHGV